MALALIIGNKNLSSWSLRPYLALRHTGTAFDEVLVWLDRPSSRADIARYSPSGRVPALHHDGQVIWDSLAICEYLAELYPEARLWPEDRAARAHARSISAEMHAGFQALRTHMPMNIRAELPGQGRTQDVSCDIDRITTIWRETRARFGAGGDFLFGHFTIADAMYAPVVTRFRTYGVELDDPCAAYSQAIWAVPAMQEWEAAARAEQ